MRFKCIDNRGYEGRLTLGKVYGELFSPSTDDGFIAIGFDDDTEGEVFGERFERDKDDLQEEAFDAIRSMPPRRADEELEEFKERMEQQVMTQLAIPRSMLGAEITLPKVPPKHTRMRRSNTRWLDDDDMSVVKKMVKNGMLSEATAKRVLASHGGGDA